jgi:putative ABC transport system substrate-binding protein
MRRRDLLGLLAACSAATGVSAQITTGLPSVGFIGFASAEGDRPLLSGFREGLKDLGHEEGRTILLEARHAGGDLALAARFIDELVRKPVTVLVAPGPAAARALRRATQIPVVAIGLPPAASDPELFSNLARPGGSVTGFSSLGEDLSAKRIELLREVLPGAAVLGILHNGIDPLFRAWGEETERWVRAQGLRPVRLALQSGSPAEMTDLLRSFRNQGGEALIVVHDFLTATLKSDVFRTSLALGIAAIGDEAQFAEFGALFSFGPDKPDLFRRAASYVDRIIKGEKAGDLPIQLPTKVYLVLNLNTARALNLRVPPSLLARADEVIE